LSVEKGIAQLLDAWENWVPGTLELTVVGDGPLRSELESRRVPNVRFEGRLSSADLRRLMLSARALVFPSIWYEGQPMVLLEAMAAGLPLLVSNIGGIPETVAATRTAVMARPGDIESWTLALDHLHDPVWLENAGSSARVLFEERYTPEIGLAGLIDQYAAAIANRRS
jgi:glycosyltransferase involved in cell wall biosynthesis